MNEHNICGVLVMTRPDIIPVVENSLNALSGVEVHATNSDGKLVVTVEDTQSNKCIDVINSLNSVSGVVSTSLIYQHSESEESHQELAQ